MGNYPPGPMAAAPGHQEGLSPAGALLVITLCDSHGLAKTVIGRPLMAPPHPRAEENDRSVRKSVDRSLRIRTRAQVSDVPGDKKDENLHRPFSS
jgi:hypothetical protein